MGAREDIGWPGIQEYKLKDKFLQSKVPPAKDLHGRPIYTLKEDLQFASSVAGGRPEYGEGGGTKFYIPNHRDLLEPVYYKQDLSDVGKPTLGLQVILNFEMEYGNAVDYVDYDGATGELWGIYLTKGLHFDDMENKLPLPTTIHFFRTFGNIFCYPESGFYCQETKQFVSGPAPVFDPNGEELTPEEVEYEFYRLEVAG